MDNNIRNILLNSKIDFTNILIGLDSYGVLDFDNFEITPSEYLKFSKEDYKVSNTKSWINSISNAKRAIDCQIDTIIKSLKIDTSDKNLSNFCNAILIEEKSLPFKLQIIKALNLAPVFLISNIRNLRNKVEHEYSPISKEDAKSAIELAEFFLNSVKSKFEKMASFEFTDETKRSKVSPAVISGMFFDINNKEIVIRYEENNFRINSKDRNYLPIVALMVMAGNQDDEFLEILKYFLKINDHPIPSDRIKITEFF